MKETDDPRPSNAALLLTAAGSSRRMGDGRKKEYRNLHGMPVLIRSLVPFLRISAFKQVIITLPPDHQPGVTQLLQSLPQDLHHFLPLIKLVEGGETRQKSVLRGLEAIDSNPQIVLIHDAARPWIRPHTIRAVLSTTDEFGACIPVVPSTDAMKQIDADGVISAHLKRTATVCAQTPQGFGYSDILTAHHHAAVDGIHYIDDSEIYSKYIGNVHTVEGDLDNIKITFPADFEQNRKEAET